MIDNDWNELGEKPPVGWYGEVTWGSKVFWHEVVILPRDRYAMFRNGSWTVNEFSDDLEFREFKSDRDKAIDAACKIIDAGDYNSTIDISFSLRRAIEDLVDAGFRIPD